ncbi:MAG: hypothetical protein Ct9H300mP27_07060 [Chloroflexota bacterium]|nr:MAG: hypothetical protein Ct9H300mP27_07060 [Chloroflexota bacterium]
MLKAHALLGRVGPLLSNQYRIIRVDARGFGRSTVPKPGYDWSLANFSNDLESLLKRVGYQKIHLIGKLLVVPKALPNFPMIILIGFHTGFRMHLSIQI